MEKILNYKSVYEAVEGQFKRTHLGERREPEVTLMRYVGSIIDPLLEKYGFKYQQSGTPSKGENGARVIYSHSGWVCRVSVMPPPHWRKKNPPNFYIGVFHKTDMNCPVAFQESLPITSGVTEEVLEQFVKRIVERIGTIT